MSIHHQGIIEPPVDRLLDKSDSKYGLVIFSARRARQINAYYSQLHEGLFEYVGPLVDVDTNEKSLSVAMREIDEGLLDASAAENATFSENGQAQLERDLTAEDFYGADFFSQDQDADVTAMFSEIPAADDSRLPEEQAAAEQADGDQADAAEGTDQQD